MRDPLQPMEIIRMPDDLTRNLSFPKRSVHLDFHTGPQVPDVGRDFNAAAFAQTFKDAHVDGVCVFAKCHHGNLYYHTNRPERHPSLPLELNLLEQQIEALHSQDILASVYLSVQCDEYAANTHPEWIALTPELKQVKGSGSALKPAWQILDMSSPYQDFLADQLQEVMHKFAPIDGIVMDMCWDQPSCSKWAIDGMRKRGYDPRLDGDRSRYAREVSHSYMQRYLDIIEKAQKGRPSMGVWFNSRPKTRLHDEKKFVHHVLIECLPTGGWGYAYFPYVARYVRSVAPMKTVSHTGRFFKSWGDNSGLKPFMALKYECCQILSQQIANGIGDLMHPRAVPDPAVYDLIGRVYRYIETCEPYVEGGTLLSQIAVVINPDLGDHPSPAAYGAVRALQQLRHQFDIVQSDSEFSNYELVIVTEDVKIDSYLKARLAAYLAAGGALMVFGPAAQDEAGGPAMPELGFEARGESPYSHTFLHALPAVSDGLADYRYVMYERGFRMTPAIGANTLVLVGEPYFEREYTHFSGHEYTPEDKVTDFAAIVKRDRVISFAVPLLAAYGKHAAPNYRTLLGNCIELLLPHPLLRIEGASNIETTIVRVGNRLIVHFLSFCAERRADGLDIVEDAIPMVNVPVAVKVEVRPTRVFLAPDERDVAYRYCDGYVHANISEDKGHAMLIIEEVES